MEYLDSKVLLSKIEKMKDKIKEAWHAGYEQSMEDSFHENEKSFEDSMFYKENIELFKRKGSA